MQCVASAGAARRVCQGWHDDGDSIALVPTMGNLHRGHLSLVERARALSQRVVVSIFVNPSQFGPQEDYQAYPRSLRQDQRLLEPYCDLLFAPTATAMYPQGAPHCSRVSVPDVSQGLCGAFRLGHFEGVATVVAKLIHIHSPQILVLGEKDYQQLMVLRRMVADLNMPVTVVSGPTVREADGLAMSSRNRFLDADQRQRASQLYQLLQAAAQECSAGESLDVVGRRARQRLSQLFELDYVEIRNAIDLLPPTEADAHLVVLAAVRLGSTRLIDNLRFERNVAN